MDHTAERVLVPPDSARVAVPRIRIGVSDGGTPLVSYDVPAQEALGVGPLAPLRHAPGAWRTPSRPPRAALRARGLAPNMVGERLLLGID